MPEQELTGLRVLVVDDDHVFLRLMEGILTKLSCRAIFCENGHQALQALRAHSFDICFMDIMMPEMGGIEATQIIRDEISRILPIIAITSSGMKATQEKCQDVGMNDFIIKPVSVAIVQEIIARYALKTF